MYGLRTLYLEGRTAPFTHIHWRRFATKDIPYHDATTFDKWLLDRWGEKDELLKHHQQHGRFPSSNGHIKAKIKLKSPLELAQILTSGAAVLVLWWSLKVVLWMCRLSWSGAVSAYDI